MLHCIALQGFNTIAMLCRSVVEGRAARKEVDRWRRTPARSFCSHRFRRQSRNKLPIHLPPSSEKPSYLTQLCGRIHVRKCAYMLGLFHWFLAFPIVRWERGFGLEDVEPEWIGETSYCLSGERYVRI